MMEPMNLGSPVSSPSAFFAPSATSAVSYPPHSPPPPHTSGPGGSTTGYLPPYLLGDYSHHGSGGRPGPSGSLSPTKQSRSFSSHPSYLAQSSSSTSPALVIGTPVGSHRGEPFATPITPAAGGGTPASTMRTPATDKPGGPPTSGMYSTPRHKRLALGRTGSSLHGAQSTPNLDGSIPAAGSYGSDDAASSEDYWIRVFGFMPDRRAAVLRLFSSIGTVIERRPVDVGAGGFHNWMDLRFKSRLDAQKALCKNGIIFEDNVMLGVVPVKDGQRSVGFSSAAITNRDDSDVSLLAVGGSSSDVANQSHYGTPTAMTTPGRQIRSLTKSYKAAQVESELSMSMSTPSKNDGLVNRAMEYIFGW